MGSKLEHPNVELPPEKLVMVTGGNTGVWPALLGAEEAEVKALKVEYIKPDLSSLQTTKDFIRETKQRMQSLNVLMCNTGIAFVQQGYTIMSFTSK